MNNPIQAIQNALFLLKEEESFSEQGRQDLEIVISETERMAALIDRLRATYRPTHSDDYQDVQLNDVVEYVHALTATHMRHSDIRFEFQPDPDLPPISGIPEQLRQVILNLFMNAIDAMRNGGQLTVRSEQSTANKRRSCSPSPTPVPESTLSSCRTSSNRSSPTRIRAPGSV